MPNFSEVDALSGLTVYGEDLQVEENRTEAGMPCLLTQERKAAVMRGSALR